jgi:hypothetical protein
VTVEVSLPKAETTMSLCICIAAAAVAATNFASPEVGYFPGSFFEAKAKAHLQRRAMEQWPGPSQIVTLWRSEGFNPRETMAILLGMSASHDPVLIPLYREAVMSADDRVRMAAAYGYRDLLGDAQPDVSGGVDLRVAEQLAAEMLLVQKTLAEQPLVEFWLQAALMNDGDAIPGWRGVTFKRPQGTCLRAVEQVMEFEDFRYLATAYRLAKTKVLRVGLMRLLEAVTLQVFFAKPAEGRTGWGTKEVDEALRAAELFVDDWIDVRCTTDPNSILSVPMNAMGVRGAQPLAADAYDFWLQVLKRGHASWRMMAARQLYNLGGRWSQLSVLQSDSKQQTAEIDELVEWYGLLPAHIQNRRSANLPVRP